MLVSGNPETHLLQNSKVVQITCFAKNAFETWCQPVLDGVDLRVACISGASLLRDGVLVQARLVG